VGLVLLVPTWLTGWLIGGFRVRVVDNLSSGNVKNLECWLDDSRFEFVRGARAPRFGSEEAVRLCCRELLSS
jgi:nucleoside-diphosphate-sugar epimerase